VLTTKFLRPSASIRSSFEIIPFRNTNQRVCRAKLLSESIPGGTEGREVQL
jgi:hypothetical protein